MYRIWPPLTVLTLVQQGSPFSSMSLIFLSWFDHFYYIQMCFSGFHLKNVHISSTVTYLLCSTFYSNTSKELTPLVSYVVCLVSSKTISMRLPWMTLLKHILSSSSMSSLMFNAMDNTWSSSYFAFCRVSYN